ncbi:MAG: NADH-quinone oxidoreductase subunit N [Actinomycetota bacterium]|nr:NADH-quinone oxidoreductase subunit N [Actinomycetota bacterium]
MNENPAALAPEALLLLGAVSVLLVGSFVPRRSQWVTRALTALTLLAALAASIAAAGDPGEVVYDGVWAVDGVTTAARLIVLPATLLTLGLAIPQVRGDKRETEFSVLLMLGALGALALAGASDLMVLAVAYLLASLPLYALAGFARDPSGTEAALKLYLLGAFLGIAMLLGVTLLYGVAGATTYAELAERLPDAPRAPVALGVVCLLAGLMFKVGGVPGHFWVPDVAQGARTPAAAFITTVPKVGGLVAAYRVLDAVPTAVVDWPLLVAILAGLTMTLGNLAAFFQDSPRRLLGWSTVSQAGYLLMAVAVAGRADLAMPSLLLYLAAYSVTNLGAFAVVACLEQRQTLADYRGLARSRPALAGALAICLLGLVGTPPTAVFVGKVVVFGAAWDGGLAWLVVLAAVNTVASLFYYLRWLAPAFGTDAVSAGTAARAPDEDRAGTWWAEFAAVTAGASVIALGLFGGPALELATTPLLR